MALFENYDRRIEKINKVLAQYGLSSVEECRELCKSKGFDPYEIVAGIQPICFETFAGHTALVLQLQSSRVLRPLLKLQS